MLPVQILIPIPQPGYCGQVYAVFLPRKPPIGKTHFSFGAAGPAFPCFFCFSFFGEEGRPIFSSGLTKPSFPAKQGRQYKHRRTFAPFWGNTGCFFNLSPHRFLPGKRSIALLLPGLPLLLAFFLAILRQDQSN